MPTRFTTLSLLCHSFMNILADDSLFFFFFFNDTATTEIYTLSLHDALPIFTGHDGTVKATYRVFGDRIDGTYLAVDRTHAQDRKSTRLNSSHLVISYAVFCLKKKKKSTRHR